MSTLRKEITVAAQPEHAFAVFTERIGEWWPLHTHSMSLSRQGAPATANAMEPGVGGRLYETAPDGTEYVWGEVTTWEPPQRVAYTWRVDRDDDRHTHVEVTFTAVEDGTLVVVVHSGWEIWAERMDEMIGSYDEGWEPVLAAYGEAT